MNGYRITRQYIERLSDKDLFEMWKVSKDDIEYEAVIIHYLIECEMERRKMKVADSYDLYTQGIITEEQLIQRSK